jgi:alcohol dehydrogenase class IV
MDAAKAIALMCVAEGDITDYLYQRRPAQPILPLIAVPTTCGTGSEGNGTAVLSNPETHDKQGMRNNYFLPRVSIVDPELMKTMPKDILASVGFDALCHNMEALLSRKRQPFADMMALRGIALTVEHLPRVYAGEGDEADWEAVTLASTLGGMSIFTSSVAAPHGLEHPASGLRDIVHGRGLAALTPVIYERSLSAAPEQFETIAKLLGGKTAADCPDAVRRFLEKIDLNITLSQQGVLGEDVEWMTDNCFQVSAMMLQNHPCAFSREDVAEIYRAAL